MSRPIIRREALDAYERWEPSAFGVASVTHAASKEEREPDAEALLAAARAREVAIAAIRETARQEGYATGYAAGREEGLAQGLAEGRESGASQINAACSALQAVADSWHAAFAEIDQAMAEQVLDLALQFSQCLVRQALVAQPERVLPLVQELLRDVSDAQRPATVRLHPEDLELVRTELGGECELAGWSLFADPGMTRGGCLVQTRHGAIDARLEMRWNSLTSALERTMPWNPA